MKSDRAEQHLKSLDTAPVIPLLWLRPTSADRMNANERPDF